MRRFKARRVTSSPFIDLPIRRRLFHEAVLSHKKLVGRVETLIKSGNGLTSCGSPRIISPRCERKTQVSFHDTILSTDGRVPTGMERVSSDLTRVSCRDGHAMTILLDNGCCGVL